MPTCCTLKRKIKDIRYNYGQKAVEHFLKNFVCSDCGENRLVILNIHHIHGKKVDDFKTLCFNCHMIEHNKKIKNDTFFSCTMIQEKKMELEKNRDKKILSLLNEGCSIRVIMKNIKADIYRVHKVMKENNFICQSRKKPIKLI